MPPRKKKKTSVDPYDRGTPQTRKRLKRESTLQRLIRQGAIDPDMERAAAEIDRIYTAITRQLFAKTSSMERVDGGRSAAPVPDWLLDAYLKRYIPFTQELQQHLKAPALAVIVDVVVDDRSLKWIENARELPKGFARQILLSSLKFYCNLAQWGRGDIHR